VLAIRRNVLSLSVLFKKCLALSATTFLFALIVGCEPQAPQSPVSSSGNLPACAQQAGDKCNCSDFTYQEDAQAVLNADKSDPHQLDGPNKNGKACESLSSRKSSQSSDSRPLPEPASRLATSAHLTLGNPSRATTSVTNGDNYLIEKPQYALSYNQTKGVPNWVSWQLNRSWLGSTPRQDNFRPDDTLPSNWYHVKPSDYTNTGYDKGHMAPSADRTKKVTDNAATFVMSNIIPQTPDLNQGPWADLEDYTRELVNQGKELYIIAGTEGKKEAIASGKVTVPAKTWKIIVVLDRPGLGVKGVTTSTRVIAVEMPNSQGIRNSNWKTYRTTVQKIESVTGYNFLSNVPVSVQKVIENRADNQ
jgi:endonuclease G